MTKITGLSLPESHRTILQILSALAWADGHLSSEEIDLLLEEFKEDLPTSPTPITSKQDINFSGFNLDVDPVVIEEIENRVNAEEAFKEFIKNYEKNPIPLEELVPKLKTYEDRCLTVKLAYMLICIGYVPQKHSIPPTEKALYRQLIQLLNLDNGVVREIEWQADQELDKFQHPFKAFITNIKNFFNKTKRHRFNGLKKYNLKGKLSLK